MPVSGLTGVTAVAAGTGYSLALKSDGSVWAWGNNEYGQLGDGTTTGRLTPVAVSGLTGIVGIAGSGNASYALSADGSLWVWGYNQSGELGLGDYVNRLSPAHLLPPTGYRFTSIAAGLNSGHPVATLAPVPEPSTLALSARAPSACWPARGDGGSGRQRNARFHQLNQEAAPGHDHGRPSNVWRMFLACPFRSARFSVPTFHDFQRQGFSAFASVLGREVAHDLGEGK